MSLMWAIYWIEVLGSAQSFLFVGLVFFLVAPIARLMWAADTWKDSLRESRMSGQWSFTKRSLCIGAFIAGFLIFLPSPKTMYAMLAANIGQQVIESPEMKQIGGKAFKILNDKLDELAGEEKKGE